MTAYQNETNLIASMYPEYTISVLEMDNEPGSLIVHVYGVETENKRTVRRSIIQASSDLEYSLVPVIFDIRETQTIYPEIHYGTLLRKFNIKMNKHASTYIQQEYIYTTKPQVDNVPTEDNQFSLAA
ncbi:hypothetical protein H6G58_21770 [Arthrospira platensis FACHB-971]|nr:hypothetical protein [Arthrospira platensis FACHB-971]